MPKSKGNLTSKNKRKGKNPYVKRELTLPTVHDEPTGPDLINNLNNDCLGRVFQYLSFADKLKIERVCKRWRGLSRLAWENVDTLRLDRSTGSHFHQLPPESRTNKGVEKLLKKCGSNVKQLKLCNYCDWKIIPIIHEYCQNLRTLEIGFDCFNWRSKTFFPQLQKVTLQYDARGNRRFPEKALQALPPKSLAEIDLSITGSSHGKGTLPRIAAPVFKNLVKLSKIALDFFHLESEVVTVISEKSTLISLSMRSCSLEGGLSCLTLLTSLEHLELGEVEQVNDNFLKEISKACHNLKSLHIASCNFTDKGISNLWRLSQLEQLDISEVEHLTDAPLGNLNNLKSLSCFDCTGVHDHGIIELMQHAKNLVHLSLGRTAVTEKIFSIANEITKKRTNDLTLYIYVDDDLIDSWDEEDVSPLLNIV